MRALVWSPINAFRPLVSATKTSTFVGACGADLRVQSCDSGLYDELQASLSRFLNGGETDHIGLVGTEVDTERIEFVSFLLCQFIEQWHGDHCLYSPERIYPVTQETPRDLNTSTAFGTLHPVPVVARSAQYSLLLSGPFRFEAQ